MHERLYLVIRSIIDQGKRSELILKKGMFIKLGRLKFKVKELRIGAFEKTKDDRKKILKRRELVWRTKQNAIKKADQVLLIDSSSNNKDEQIPTYFRAFDLDEKSEEVIAGEKNFIPIQ